MKSLVLLLAVLCASALANSFTFKGGSKSVDVAPVYPTNPAFYFASPGGRQNAATWMYGNYMYIFGGASSAGLRNDFFRMNLATSAWSYIGGPKIASQNGSYTGTLWPGARHSAYTWSYGRRLYIFGGLGYGKNSTLGKLNDMWSYDLMQDTWTWLGGSSSVDTLGVYISSPFIFPRATIWPGGRYEGSFWQRANKAEFWLCGGTVFTSANDNAVISDMWYYNVSTNAWRYVSGSLTPNELPITSGPNARPGTRIRAHTWTDNSTGLMWLYGGWGDCIYNNGQSFSLMSDLWAFNPQYSNWTLITGNATCSLGGSFTGPNQHPSARDSGVTWFDKNRRILMLFGGWGYDGFGNGYFGALSDVWEFSLTTKKWAFRGGNKYSQGKSYYPPNTTPLPGGRYAAMGGADPLEDRFWIYGGYGRAETNSIGYIEEQWVYNY